MLTFWSQATPIDPITCFCSPEGLCRVLFADDDPVAALTDALRVYGQDLEPVQQADEVVWRQLDQYFAGDRRVFDLSLDFALVSQATEPYLRVVQEIPYGETLTYGEVAARAGKPNGAQAAGQAVGRNPLPIVVPCHRVVAADGTLGGYGGGLDRKRTLLALEGLPELPGGWQDSDRKRRGLDS